MKKLFISLIFLFSFFFSFFSPSHTLAVAVEPFPPFSVEGNPDDDYYFGAIFPLFRYFRPRALEIYENLDRSRTYVDLEICPGAGADRRDYECNNQGDGCDGGEVDLCHASATNRSFAKTTISKNGSCKLERKTDPDNPGELINGRCEYTKRPSVETKVKGTDFATRDSANKSELDASYSQLVFPKIQSESGAYAQIGNAIHSTSWGSQYLNSDLCESDVRRAVVLRRAKQTKNTVRETGEWPLGWVDWGYTIPSGKTLLEMNDTLPDDVSSMLNNIVEGLDDFYLTGGNLAKTSDVSDDKQALCQAMKNHRNQKNPPEWIKDFDLVPLYPPSFRMGYVRPSICIWELCCPTYRCPLAEGELLGNKRGLYYDISVSTAYNAALDELFLTYPLGESTKIFNTLLTNNPLIRYLSSASPKATPSQITIQLNSQLKGSCLDYIPWSNWLGFGTHLDYLDSGNFLGPNKTCPDYELMPDANKERAAATSTSILDVLINLIWGKKVDDVEPDKYHLLTIPDAMGQSLGEIQQYVYDTRDTLSELESVKEYNRGLSNIVDDSKENLYGGKSLGPADARRRLGYYSCSDPMFSSQLDTSIEAYALGTRVGCDQSSNTTSKCDPAKFASIIADSNWKLPTSNAQAIIKNSAMFVDGKLNPELEEVYSQVSEETGVPCEILAGHHFEEATQFFVSGGDPTKHSVANGRALNEIGQTLLESAQLAATEVSNRPYYEKNTAGLIAAMSNFNGGGNANCQLGFPSPIPYGGCPRLFPGEDDPYVTNLLDAKHSGMFLLYCGDFTPCIPPKIYGDDRPGAFSAALVVHEYLLNTNPTTSPSPTTSASPTNIPTNIGSAFFPQTCGDGALKTALGCLPYERVAFISAILGFLVGISGAIALVTMLIATIQIMTASGDTKKIQAGRDLFSSAVAGLLFLIFSVSLLRLIAGDIIKLPGF